METQITINSDSGLALIQEKTKTNESEFFYVPMAQLTQILAEGSIFKTGIMGGSHGVKALSYSKSFKGLYQIPAHSRKLNYRGNIKTYPIPNIIFKFDLLALANLRIWVTKSPIYLGSEELCVFPYGNVGTDGGICWGSSNPPKSGYTLQNIEGILDFFLSMKFNGDLTSWTSSHANLLAENEGKVVFNERSLYSASRTFNKIMEEL